MPYPPPDEEPGGIGVHDSDGLGITTIRTHKPPIAGTPPAALYREH